MFFSGSRYQSARTYTFTMRSRAIVTATNIPLPRSGTVIGYHRRLQGERLDLIANFYESDPTAFWQICNANGSVVPDALLSHPLIAIPAKGS
jgi:hypothetical protein